MEINKIRFTVTAEVKAIKKFDEDDLDIIEESIQTAIIAFLDDLMMDEFPDDESINVEIVEVIDFHEV